MTSTNFSKRATKPLRRAGFTIAELMVALVLFGIVAGGILTVLRRQLRFYASANQIVSMRGQLRQGVGVLPFDLRFASASDTLVNVVGNKYEADFYSRSDNSIEFRQVTGSSIMCGKDATAPVDTVILMPQGLAGVPATSWLTTPVVGDSILILDEGFAPGQVDDRWRAYAITAVNMASGLQGCPFVATSALLGTGELLTAADTAAKSYRLTISPSLTTNTGVPVPVRVFRRAKYQIYQAADSRWYLGYADCLSTYATAGKCSSLTPVAGPFLDSSSPPGGLTFAYYDSTGTPVSNGVAQATKIARIDVTLRAQTRGRVDLSGSSTSPAVKRDSVAFTIGLRNRR